jgi:hypothetical protein
MIEVYFNPIQAGEPRPSKELGADDQGFSDCRLGQGNSVVSQFEFTCLIASYKRRLTELLVKA